MTARIRRSDRAEDDLAWHYAYIYVDNPTVAERFTEAAEETFQDLARMPGMGVPMRFESPRLSSLRRWRVKGFSDYLVYYLPLPQKTGVLIVHVRHAAQDIPDEELLEMDLE